LGKKRFSACRLPEKKGEAGIVSRGRLDIALISMRM